VPTGLPQRQSLVAQSAAFLNRQIEQGVWGEWLPSERSLCDLLQVSRNTLRAALVQLKQEGRIASVHGAGNRILATRGRRPSRLKSHDVALLAPLPLQQLRPTVTLWIDALRSMLGERGCRLHFFQGQQYYRSNPGPALQKLISQHRHACWILTLTNEAIQRWFEGSGAPCIVAGSVYPGINLPFRDLDHRATCRHAAGVMLGLGHRRIALVLPTQRRAGDIESEAGFLEAVRQSPQAGAEAVIATHDASVPGIVQALRRVLEQQPRPTALLVANAYHYVTVATRLQQTGCRVPQDVSVVSRDEDPFLSFMLPTPARYETSPQSFAKALLRPVLELLQGSGVTQPTLRLMPDFVRGESLGAPSEGA
jgi:DNA-binding LacI/PurR family transcriptional regulator